jgi:hypothetical protein
MQNCGVEEDLPQAVPVLNQNLVFRTDAFYPCGKRGWRA